MKASAVVFLLGLALPALAQELAPSPTESIGCEPHGDHWHCEGPRPTDEPAVTTTTVADPITTTAADDEHTDAAGTGSLAPSPTESIGCEPHGDHWHCEGPRPPAETETGSTSETSVATLTTLTTTASTPSRAPTGTGAPTTTTTGTGPIVTAGAAVGVPMVGAAPVLGMVVFAALGL